MAAEKPARRVRVEGLLTHLAAALAGAFLGPEAAVAAAKLVAALFGS